MGTVAGNCPRLQGGLTLAPFPVKHACQRRPRENDPLSNGGNDISSPGRRRRLLASLMPEGAGPRRQ